MAGDAINLMHERERSPPVAIDSERAYLRVAIGQLTLTIGASHDFRESSLSSVHRALGRSGMPTLVDAEPHAIVSELRINLELLKRLASAASSTDVPWELAGGIAPQSGPAEELRTRELHEWQRHFRRSLVLSEILADEIAAGKQQNPVELRAALSSARRMIAALIRPEPTNDGQTTQK